MSSQSTSRTIDRKLATGFLVMTAAVLGLASKAPNSGNPQAVAHALNRLTWGIRPGDVEAVQRLGLKKWIDLQLHPDRISENPVLAAKLARYDTLTMSPSEMVDHYPPPEAIRAMANGRLPLPSNPQGRVIAQREIERFQRRQQRDLQDAQTDTAMKEKTKPAADNADANADSDDAGKPPLDEVHSPEQIRSLRTGTPEQRMQAFNALPSATQDQVLQRLPRGLALQLAMWGPPELQRRILVQAAPQLIVATDLQQAKILRAVYSNRQLEDVLTDFWFNHFNVFYDKGADRFLTTSFERDVIRPHVLGKFYDLLEATATSPAMLFYLDNWQSADPNAPARLARERAEARRMRQMDRMVWGPPRPWWYPPQPRFPRAQAHAKPRQGRGLNENYGRELMELHTLGVDGGYTQKDVTEVARCFTGWTIKEINHNPQFFYDDHLHDKGEKIVLGTRIKAGGGMDDGIKVLHLLAKSPATAHHISYQLAQRFVADKPPAALVDRMAATFQHTDGDLRKVMQTMLDSPDFWDAENYRAKIKSPFEMVVSSLRALNVDVTNGGRLIQILTQMGEPLYRMQPPTGYPNTGESWVSSTGLIARLNFALALTAASIPGTRVDLSPFTPGEADAQTVSNTLFHALLLDQVSPATRATVAKAVTNSQPAGEPAGARLVNASSMQGDNPVPATPAQVQIMAGLILGSPEFQRR